MRATKSGKGEGLSEVNVCCGHESSEKKRRRRGTRRTLGAMAVGRREGTSTAQPSDEGDKKANNKAAATKISCSLGPLIGWRRSKPETNYKYETEFGRRNVGDSDASETRNYHHISDTWLTTIVGPDRVRPPIDWSGGAQASPISSIHYHHACLIQGQSANQLDEHRCHCQIRFCQQVVPTHNSYDFPSPLPILVQPNANFKVPPPLKPVHGHYLPDRKCSRKQDL